MWTSAIHVHGEELGQRPDTLQVSSVMKSEGWPPEGPARGSGRRRIRECCARQPVQGHGSPTLKARTAVRGRPRQPSVLVLPDDIGAGGEIAGEDGLVLHAGLQLVLDLGQVLVVLLEG